MDPSPPRLSSNGLPPRRLLLIETDTKLLNHFPHILKTCIPDVSVDLCPSRDHARSKLAAASYHAVIADAKLAVSDSWSLLKDYQSTLSHTPFLVSIGSSEQALARQALEAGAFDALVKPVDATQIETILRPALWLYQLRVTIHLRQERIRQYKERLAASPIISPAHKQNLKKNYLDIEEAYLACLRSINHIEISLRFLEKTALDIEAEARHRTCRAFSVSDKS